MKKPRVPIWYAGLLVPTKGLEPPREYSHYALNVARLPIPPRRPTCGVYHVGIRLRQLSERTVLRRAQRTRANFWNMWQPSGAWPRLIKNVWVTSPT
jgi:hypothetical protein